MLPTFAVCFWATTAFAACTVRTRMHYVRSDDRARGGGGDPQYYPSERLQSRASSMFGPSGQHSAAVGFPYRFVFPANHPALTGPVYSQYLQSPHQSESLYSAEDFYTPSTTKQHQLSDHKHHHQQQQQQHQQQLAYESVGKMQYDFLGGDGGKHHHLQQPQPYHLIAKQPKHYQSFELAPSVVQSPVHHHQPPYQPSTASVAQPIMLLIPSSGQPGAPYQTLMLVPSSASPAPMPQPSAPMFTGFQQQFQHLQAPAQFLPPGFVTHPRGAPMVNGFPSGLGGVIGAGGPGGGGGGNGGGLGKFPGAQLFHRSHDPHQHQPYQQHQLRHQFVLSHQQQQHKGSSSSVSPSSSSSSVSSSSSPSSPTSYQGSGSAHVPHRATASGTGAVRQPLEDKVSHGSGASGENPDDRVDSSSESKTEEKPPEYGDKTDVKPVKQRIVVT